MSGGDEKDGGADEQAADLLAFALAGRPERVEDGLYALPTSPPGLRRAVRQTREALAALARAEEPAAPGAELRDRLLATLEARRVRRAVVVIDMINDHLLPGSLLEVPRARAIVPAMRARLEEARAEGVPIVYVVDEHAPDDPDLDAWGTHAVAGTSGTEVYADIAPRPGDRVVKKPSYSAFFQSELARVLDELRVDTLVLTGCLTEIGLMATATDALQEGYAVEVPQDAQAGSCAEAEMAALGTIGIMAPFGPARKARLERLARHAV